MSQKSFKRELLEVFLQSLLMSSCVLLTEACVAVGVIMRYSNVGAWIVAIIVAAILGLLFSRLIIKYVYERNN